MINAIKNLSAKYRVLFVISVLWVFCVLGMSWSYRGLIPDGHIYFDLSNFVFFGLIPVVLLWGMIWVIHGFKEKK